MTASIPAEGENVEALVQATVRHCVEWIKVRSVGPVYTLWVSLISSLRTQYPSCQHKG